MCEWYLHSHTFQISRVLSRSICFPLRWELIQSHFLLLTITAFFFPEVALPPTVSCCSYPRPSICQNKCMWVINAARNVCWTTGNFLFRKRSWELPVEQCIVGLLAAGPWPQLQLTKGMGGGERKKRRQLPTDIFIHVAWAENGLIQVKIFQVN